MSGMLKRKIVPALVAGALAIGGMFATATAAHATGNPSRLDQGDLSQACHLSYGAGWNAQLLGNTAYSWKCTNASNPALKNVDINNYCMSMWGVWAMTTNPNSPYSWKCQGY